MRKRCQDEFFVQTKSILTPFLRGPMLSDADRGARFWVRGSDLSCYDDFVQLPLPVRETLRNSRRRGDWTCWIGLRTTRRGLPVEVRDQATRRLAVLQRRRGNLLAAVDLWHQAAGENHVYAHVELAKYYEHRTHDYGRAAGWTQTAVELVKAPGFPRYDRGRWLPELEHRLNRLHRKMGRT